MIILFIVLALVFLASGGVGLFYVNTANHVAHNSALFFLGNLGFGTFLAVGLLILIFIALFNAEID